MWVRIFIEFVFLTVRKVLAKVLVILVETNKMLSKSVQGYRKKLMVAGLIIPVFALWVTSYVNAAYEVQRPGHDTGGKINQTYL